MASNNDVINVLNIWRARNHGKKFPKLSQTSFSGIVYYRVIIMPYHGPKVAKLIQNSSYPNRSFDRIVSVRPKKNLMPNSRTTDQIFTSKTRTNKYVKDTKHGKLFARFVNLKKQHISQYGKRACFISETAIK